MLFFPFQFPNLFKILARIFFNHNLTASIIGSDLTGMNIKESQLLLQTTLISVNDEKTRSTENKIKPKLFTHCVI